MGASQVLRLVAKSEQRITDTELTQVRENGLGNGFKVLVPTDGFRNDQTLWFGTCGECGESVNNSWRDGLWVHTVWVQRRFYANGNFAGGQSHGVDYCPTERGDKTACEVIRYA
jgi:hypothetical protein